jgi:hypothetical protein
MKVVSKMKQIVEKRKRRPHKMSGPGMSAEIEVSRLAWGERLANKLEHIANALGRQNPNTRTRMNEINNL